MKSLHFLIEFMCVSLIFTIYIVINFVMLLNLINSRLKKKITSYNEIPARLINKISYHMQFLPYKSFFNKLKYESCDNEQVLKEINYDVLDAKHNFYYIL